MRSLTIRFAGLLFLLGLLAAPTAALAAPTITVAPAAGPPGTTFTIRGGGFAANAALSIFVENAVGARFGPGGRPVGVTAGPDGAFTATVTIPPQGVPGQYRFVVADTPASPALASARFTVTGPNGETLAVAPASGPAGTPFTVTGAGFRARSTVVLAVFVEDAPVVLGRALADADGRFATTLDSSDLPAGSYLLGAGPDADARPFATAPLVVTAPGTMPELPNTGGGVAADQATGMRPILAATLIGVVCATLLARCRRVAR